VGKPPDEETAVATNATRLMSPLTCTGLKPHFLDKLATHGVVLPPTFFEEEDDQAFRSTFSAASFGGFS
jgi:hypothetical protein